MNLVSVLARCPPLSELPLRAVADLSRFVEQRALELGQPLFAVGDRSEHLHIVAAGALQLLHPSGQAIARVEAGGFLGVTAPLLPAPHTIGAVAIEPSRVIVLSRGQLDALWEQVPPAAALLEIALAGWVSKDLARAGDELMALCDRPLRTIGHPGLRALLRPVDGA